MTVYFLSGVCSALVLVALAMSLARRLNLLARPNARSSHKEPTPAIGGVGIVVPTLAVLVIAALGGAVDAMILAIAGMCVAVVGLWDDLQNLSIAIRLFIQVIASIIVAVGLAGDLPVVALVTVAFLILWSINLFNFMDGIDGIAAVQVLVFALGVFLLAESDSGWIIATTAVLAGASLGFLAFNWPPAQIFMGDVASGFLGLIISAIVVLLSLADALSIAAAVILLAGFWFDASYTLMIRVVTRQRFMGAHRSHLYQKVALQFGHRTTTISFLSFGLLWQMPIATLANVYRGNELLWVILAIAPVAALCVYFRAGIQE